MRSYPAYRFREADICLLEPQPCVPPVLPIASRYPTLRIHGPEVEYHVLAVLRTSGREWLQVEIASVTAFAPRLGATKEVYDAVFLVCSCGLLAFGHGGRACQRLSGRDTSRVRLQRRCSFQLPLPVVSSLCGRVYQSEPGCFHRKPTLSGVQDKANSLRQPTSKAVLAKPLRRRFVFLVRPSHNDSQRVVRQRPLENLGLVTRRTHPHITLLRPLFCFADIWTTFNGDRGTKSKPIPGSHEVYGFLTTAPNAVVEPIHPKAMLRWGMPPPPKIGRPPVTNIRNTSSPHWRGWLKPENRCLVPVDSFTEYERAERKAPTV
jgi:hypothetical protein